MCKLLVLENHPQKLVPCESRCYEANWLLAAGVMYAVAIGISAIGLYLLS